MRITPAPKIYPLKRKKMANDNHLFSIPCYNGTMLKQDYYNDFFEIGQQKINFSFFELSLPVDLCQRDLAFIWLTKGQKPQRDAFYDFKGKKLTGEILDELNYQFMRRLQKEGLITLKELYIDGTKIEANANRYTFVWRGSINYHLAGLLDTIDALYARYNALVYENGYGPKYDIGEARMFVIEGMEKVRKVIGENRRRKLTKHKKIPNNTILEIDSCSPLEIVKLQKNLMRIAEGEGILFVSCRSFMRNWKNAAAV